MSAGHRSVSSEIGSSANVAEAVAETIGTRVPSAIPTAVEPVPGYVPRGPAESTFGTKAIIRNLPTAPDAAFGAFRGADLMEVVIGDDDRQAISDVTLSPWRHICALGIRTATGRDYVGTGWMTGPKTVMTAGHCVFMHDQGGVAGFLGLSTS